MQKHFRVLVIQRHLFPQQHTIQLQMEPCKRQIVPNFKQHEQQEQVLVDSYVEEIVLDQNADLPVKLPNINQSKRYDIREAIQRFVQMLQQIYFLLEQDDGHVEVNEQVEIEKRERAANVVSWAFKVRT